MTEYKYPETHIDESTGALMHLVKTYPNFATYAHPKGYLVSYKPCELGILNTKEIIAKMLEDDKKKAGIYEELK